MTTTLLAFSAEDSDRIEPLVADWQHTFRKLAVDRAAGHPPLTTELEAHGGPVYLLLTDGFLRNPNCLSGLLEWLNENPDVALFLANEQEGERLRTPAGRMQYVHHWQERYIDLRRDAAAYSGDDRAGFDRYLAKIRGISIEVERLVSRLWELRPQSITAHAPPEREHPRQLIERAWDLAEAGDRAGAQVQWRIAAEEFPDHPDICYEHGLFLAMEARDLGGARGEIDRLLQENSSHTDALYLSGEIYRTQGNYPAAREDWERLYDLDPNYPELDLRLGTLLSEHVAGAEAMALSLLKRASKRKDASADTYYRYGTLLDSAFGRRKKATKQLQRAVALDPEFAAAHYRLAVWLYEEGASEEARNHYILATALDDRYVTPANQRAFLEATPPKPLPPPKMDDPLSSLKENIARLEEMLAVRTSPAPASAPPAPGKGKTVLVSGATSGIGKATAERLARDGYRLILLGRRKERLNELKEKFRKGETEIHTLQLDVRGRDEVATAIDNLPKEWRRIDVLINNAGKAKGFDPIHSGDIDHWEEMIDVNLKGLLYLTRAVTPGMVERGSGMVINVASTAGKEVYPNGNVYCATKHGVDALTYAMRLDLVHHGIRVGQICPAHVEETEFAVVRFDGDRERAKIYEDFQPLRSADVAEAIHFMISQPAHVNIMDLVLQGTQQASSTVIDRSGRPGREDREQ
jgi:NADP-dependent 3-hydroxy acid dehydrogenase YdfG/Flp pilus assembly protein TadD